LNLVGTKATTVAAIAGRTYGVVTRAQLLGAGMSSREIHGRLERGELLRVHRGVYRVGHEAPSVEAKYMAAVLAGGDGALLCGAAAAYLLGLIRGEPPEPEIVTPRKCRVDAVRTRRSNHGNSTIWKGIPVTSPAQTLVDLAPDLPDEDLARVCHEAGLRHYTKPRQVKEALARRPNAPGAARLWAIMNGDVKVVLSKLEARFLDRLREIRRPLPVTNRPAGSKRVDCRWSEYDLTVELDGFRTHRSRHAWEQDRRREREAYARGDQFRRYTWGDVFEDPTAMLAELEQLLPRLP
jgi:very-short-patch-repair endonuclease